MEAVIDLIFLGSKIIVDGDCSYEIKMLAPWKKRYDKPRQRIKKQRPHCLHWQWEDQRRSNQSILKEIDPEYSLEGLMLKLKLQCFGHLMRTTDLLEKT